MNRSEKFSSGGYAGDWGVTGRDGGNLLLQGSYLIAVDIPPPRRILGTKKKSVRAGAAARFQSCRREY